MIGSFTNLLISLNQTPPQKVERGLRGAPADEVTVAGEYQLAVLRVRVVGERDEDEADELALLSLCEEIKGSAGYRASLPLALHLSNPITCGFAPLQNIFACKQQLSPRGSFPAP